MNAPTIVRTNTAELYDAYVMKNFAKAPLTIVRGEGVWAWDDTGKKYLDFVSGIAVNALGHCHPVWVEAIRRQAGELVHCSNLYRNPGYGELARRLVQQAGPGRVYLCNSGTEANEGLIKLARLHGLRKSGEEGKCIKILCAKNAFHGRTFGGMSATPQEKIQKGFRPLVPGFAFGELNNLQSFADLVDEHTAAIFIETVQGEGGVTPCTDGFLWGLRQLCDRHNLLLMLDEVQCGIGRTGAFYAFQHSGVRADAIGMAKGIANGFPMGAIWAAEPHAELFTPGSHGTTFGGSPLACAAALATLDVIQRDDLIRKVAVNGAAWKAELEQLVVEFPTQVKAVTGRGYMLGLALQSDPAAYLPLLREGGLLCPTAGGNTIRLLPPLIATSEHLKLATDIIRGALKKKGTVA
ncbi:MAG: acetylornithine/succinylornithine family transaminase [Candidatus Didemnitutus sp.]|nr:acetylornithine/succinylornithine family transaminase [Candidatus Didemnitutus sp.]